MRKGDAVPDMTPPAPLVERRHTDAATGYYANAESLAMHFARFDNDRTAMLVEALAPFSRAADLADGAMLGRYGKAELPDDTTVLGALKLTLGDIRRARDAVRVQESHGGERYPDIQRLQLGKQED